MFGHLFDKYKIYKINDKGFAVKEMYTRPFLGEWVDKDGNKTWSLNRFIHNCIVSTCEEAHQVIEKRKAYLKKTTPKVEFAKECYAPHPFLKYKD